MPWVNSHFQKGVVVTFDDNMYDFIIDNNQNELESILGKYKKCKDLKIVERCNLSCGKFIEIMSNLKNWAPSDKKSSSKVYVMGNNKVCDREHYKNTFVNGNECFKLSCKMDRISIGNICMLSDVVAHNVLIRWFTSNFRIANNDVRMLIFQTYYKLVEKIYFNQNVSLYFK